MSGEEISSLDQYEDIYVEVFYADKIPSELRRSLETELGNDYLEKYTRPVMNPNADPIMTVEHMDELHTLFGEEISRENIEELLED